MVLPQTHIDRLSQALLKNAMMAARPRWFVRGDGSINEEEYADWSRDFVHYHGSGAPSENLSQVEVRTLPDVYVAILNNKIAELKETSGNRDFNQGGTTAGVTAASAIAALQEAGSKLSRDMIGSAYRAYARMCYLVIELIRQFYDMPRCFRILAPNGADGFARYTNAGIRPQTEDVCGVLTCRLPVFDVRVKAARAGAYSRISQNEFALQLYKNGFFDPARAGQALAALSMMDFEGREDVIQTVQRQTLRMQSMGSPQNAAMQGGMQGRTPMQMPAQAPMGQGGKKSLVEQALLLRARAPQAKADAAKSTLPNKGREADAARAQKNASQRAAREKAEVKVP